MQSSVESAGVKSSLRACQNCAKAKAKCLPRPDSQDKTCARSVLGQLSAITETTADAILLSKMLEIEEDMHCSYAQQQKKEAA